MIRYQHETWRDVVERIAKKRFMEQECTTAYDREIRVIKKLKKREPTNDEMANAAWEALYEWD